MSGTESCPVADAYNPRMQPQRNIIPAAQYLRMSDEAQQYSLDNQRTAIQEYAARYGFAVVETYADAGKSGVIATNRTGLRQLLADVVNGDAKYKAILVYDVSRWGRFVDNDEAAHYEFLCSSSGIPLHYCAEQFSNDGTVASSLLKAVKRSMATEFSRELGEKVFRGKSRLVQMGYWVGGVAGYGYRRLMVSADGKPKQLMRLGESKNLTTDRVILVPGPKEQVECVKRIFSEVLKGKGCTVIARDLNQNGILHYGKLWTHQDVFDIVTHPKYAGWNVWHRSTARLRSKEQRVDSADWITRKGSFAPIVDQKTFDRAQAMLPRHADSLWSNEEILQKLRGLLAEKGRLTETLILKTTGMPNPKTLAAHFGSYRRAYEAAGYKPPKEEGFRYEQCKRTLCLRQTVVKKIKEMFPKNVEITHASHRSHAVLQIDHSFLVSMLFCRQKRRRGKLHWVVEPHPAERGNMTLLCKMNRLHNQVLGFYLFPHMNEYRSHRSFRNDPWLRTGIKVRSLSEFYQAATGIRELNRSELLIAAG